MVNGFFILYGLIMVLVILFAMKGLMHRKPKQEIVYDYETIQDDTPQLSYRQYVKQLEWMFQMGIISVQEYNKFHQDGLMFLNTNGVESNG
jgi:hypothetical protein